MKFFTQDPEAEFRKGLIFTLVGGLVAALVVAGMCVAVRGDVPSRIYASGIAGGVFAACFFVVGLMMLRDAASLKRERNRRKERPRVSVEPRVQFQAKPPPVEPRPDVLPPFPTKRMIGVTVMFAGLILPAFYGALALAAQGAYYAIGSLFLLAVSGWMTANLLALWRSRRWGWSAGVVLFSVGLAFSLFPLGAAIWEREVRVLMIAGAATSHFVVGLIALSSLRGPWLRYLEWKPARDPMSGVDRAAVLAALRARKP